MPIKDLEARRAYGAKRYRENKHLWKNPDGTWKTENPEQRRLRKRTKYASDEIYKQNHLDYQESLRDNRRRIGPCPICECTSPASGSFSEGHLVRDHNHFTGRTRGWICRSCNLALGHAKDSPKILKALAKYLEEKMTGKDQEAVL